MSLATSPHSFSVVEVDYENVDRVRRAHKDTWHQQEGFTLTLHAVHGEGGHRRDRASSRR